jgi:hypothetical protein
MTQAQSHVNQHSCSEHLKAEVHYRLTHEEFLTWIEKHNLKWSEVKLYLYFCTLNPFGAREIEFSPDSLYAQLKIKKSAFYSAVARLEKLGLLSLKVLRATARIHPISRTTFHLNGKSSNTPESTPVERKEFHLNGKSSNKSENYQSQVAPDKDSSSPQTYSDYSSFKHTLSEAQRENFEKFVRDEWKKLTTKNGEPGEEIVSLDRFLARKEDIENWHQRFLNSPAGREAKKKAKASLHNWRDDPHFDTWIWQAFDRGYEWIQENEAEREQRKAFHDWAFETKAFEFCIQARYGGDEA